MSDDTLRRKSWLDGFMAYPLPAGQSEADTRANIVALDQALYALWKLGENLVFGWMLQPRGLLLLVARHALVIEYVQAASNGAEAARRAATLESLLATDGPMTPAAFDRAATDLQLDPLLLPLPFEPERGIGLEAMAAIVARYGIRLVEDRAVVLLDAVGFSLLTPLQQVVQLGSLSCSVNSAYATLLGREININFARTTTGDGFYIWNRARGVNANVELYQLMQFILADNAMAHEQARSPHSVPRLRTCFHVGSHYEFYQSEGLNPTAFSYLVGQVTIELARMIERALPGQILVGRFSTPMLDAGEGGSDGGKRTVVDSLDFVARTREPLKRLDGVTLAGARVDSIQCYLTGARSGDSEFGISEFEIEDKHHLRHRVYNAKVNIHRRPGAPVYLGLRDEDLGGFAARRVQVGSAGVSGGGGTGGVVSGGSRSPIQVSSRV
ncbi:hypothetical protein [Rubrivivax sp. A210]|uniref:hypothetical protein n=1 Tax=Rubrivivax sp. A210 TaxID=2772301 RepID=UPI00191840BF|nr:hypothetical protein [Rubrivivax sp. A210]